mmetsp:Transcript_25016/g.45057  ORF Transcript_25016/g.45057 Transcript_25016/m.45057 type:complete len:335 (-) Transcript_25016:133-1137(-)
MVYTGVDVLIDITQRLQVMLKQEVSHYAVPDYLAEEWQQKLRDASGPCEDRDHPPAAAVPSSSSASLGDGDSSSMAALASPSSSQINEVWREMLCEWCYQIVDHFDFNRDVVSVTMSYLDRYLATRAVNRRIFQLAAITALYLAIKLFEPGTLHMSNLVHLSRGYFTAEHIMSMENTMFQTLNWHVHPPTPYAFCSDLMILVPGDITPCVRHDMQELARFLTELSVCDYWFATRKPSSIALASIINAIELQGPYLVDAKYKAEFLHRVVGIGMDIAHDDEIIECYTRLRQIYDAGGYNPNLVEGLDAEEADGPLVDHAVSPGADNHESPRSIIL